MSNPRKTLALGELVFKFQFHDTPTNERVGELQSERIRLVRDDENGRMARQTEQITKALAAGLEPFRYQRSEGGKGPLVPDWGVAIFDATKGAHDVNVKKAFNDVKEMTGMKLVDIDVFQRLNDRNRYFVRVTFARDERPAIVLSGGQRVMLSEFLDATWGHCHVWRNEGGFNINVVCLSERDKSMLFEGEMHDLRILREGRQIKAPKQKDDVVAYVGD